MEADHDELAAVQIGIARAIPGGSSCELVERQVDVNGYKFDCLWTSRTCSAYNEGKVLALHGFPESKEMFRPLMKELARAGFCAAACDQRGYSPGASPGNQSDYLPSLLQSDALGFADELGFERFHLVGHDFGAVLGWVLATGPHKDRLLSFSSLTVPHLDAFSAGLFGPGASRRQQAASQYFEMFARGSSASLYNETIYKTFGGGPSGRWPSAQAFQKPVWWYNGVFDFAGSLLALPPLLSAGEVKQRGFDMMANLRGLFGGAPNDGKGACKPIGDVLTPTLFFCGSQDPFVLCADPFSLETKKYVKGGYRYLQVDCGHHPLNCTDANQTQIATAAILAHVKQHQHVPM